MTDKFVLLKFSQSLLLPALSLDVAVPLELTVNLAALIADPLLVLFKVIVTVFKIAVFSKLNYIME